jgi:membrane fusion protein (multidrug efflux system)
METVKEVHVEVGDKVSTGDLLIVLDKTNPQAQYQQAKLARDNAVTEYNRIDVLFKQGAVSRQTYDLAILAKDIAETNFSNAKELLEITAPIDGIVTDVMFKSGELVSPGDAVATISNTDKIKCKLWVGEADHDRIKTGQQALFSLSKDNPADSKQIVGEVSEIALSADRESHLYKIVVHADNAQGWLRPGQLVPVKIIIESIPDIMIIPKEAIIMQEEETYVYKITDNIATLTPIALGKENRKHVQIVGGLSLGESIVVYGMNRLKSGDRVKIVSSAEEVMNVSQ